SKTMKRQGNSLPWSGTRAAAVRIASSWAGDGPGPVMVLAEPERRVRSRSSAPGAGRLRTDAGESMAGLAVVADGRSRPILSTGHEAGANPFARLTRCFVTNRRRLL